MLAHQRLHIERAARQLFVRRGLCGTPVRDIAARARAAEGTPYRHWCSKRDLELTDAVLAGLDPRPRRRSPA
jgi:AcrR family transcriptional regulator